MDMTLAAFGSLLLVALALALLWARATAARLGLERELAVARQRLSEGERREADFERLRAESLQAAQAAVLTAAQQVSSKLLDDHKRETSAAKEDAESRVRQASEGLVRQVDEIAKAVQALSGQMREKGAAVDTLWRALSSPGGAGQLAEIVLANTLRSFGLEPGRDFLLQPTTEDVATGRKLRPDAVVFLPGNSVLVIDCKASKFLLEIANVEGTAAEAEAYRNLVRTMTQHLRALAEKDYKSAVHAAWRQAGHEGEIARILSVMYLPNEAALEKLYRADAEFMLRARERDIIPAGPAGLHCAISLASLEINLLRQVENQQRIAETTRALLDGLTVMLGHAASLGRGIKGAAESFARLTASVNQRLLPRARSLAKLGVQPGKALPANLPAYSVHAETGDLLIEGEAEAAEIEKPALPRLVS
ncbi:MAG TPA: DNA recombination protein RmuC [Stellaceae bacterium]|nr:DNA recombination protein RmuC [Stellaceae bacterium]